LGNRRFLVENLLAEAIATPDSRKLCHQICLKRPKSQHRHSHSAPDIASPLYAGWELDALDFASPSRAPQITVQGMLRDWALAPYLLFCAHVVVWTSYSYMAQDWAIHHDMTEAYAWGREFQLGYYKHPPFWSWVAGLWFKVFPREAWAFFILSHIVGGLGLLGVWFFAGQFVRDDRRLDSVLLLLTTPCYTFLAITFNANSIQLCLWPWAAYFFIRSLRTGEVRASILFGALVAFAFLSKYYTIVFAVSCLLAAIVHPARRSYFTSAAPYISVATALLIVSPHILWSIRHDHLAIQYAVSRTYHPDWLVRERLWDFFCGVFGFNTVAIAILLLVRVIPPRPSPHRVPKLRGNMLAFMGALALGPFLLTVLTSIVGNVRLSTNFSLPIFYATPLFLIALLRPDAARLARVTTTLTVALIVGALAAAPFVPRLLFLKDDRAPTPTVEAMQAAVQFWGETQPTPLRLVAGSWPYASGVVFYGRSNASEFIDFDLKKSPWVSEQRIAVEGLLALCLTQDAQCQRNAERFITPGSRRMQTEVYHRVGNLVGPKISFIVFAIAPK
jgi:hypothetical protein